MTKPFEAHLSTRFCALCRGWRDPSEFAITPLGQGGRHAFCLRHVSQAEADVRCAAALQILRKARVSPSSLLEVEFAPSVREQATGTK